MTINKTSIEDETILLGLDTLSTQKWANEGNVEDWVHRYLLSGRGGKTDPEFLEGL